MIADIPERRRAAAQMISAGSKSFNLPLPVNYEKIKEIKEKLCLGSTASIYGHDGAFNPDALSVTEFFEIFKSFEVDNIEK